MEGVSHLHRIQVLHRDLKPANLLLVLGTNGPVVKVAGFGSSKIVGGDCHQTPDVVTLWYRAPEVFAKAEHPRGPCRNGERNYGFPSDVWSLGCILAELFLGKVLFPGDSYQGMWALFVARLGQPPARLKDSFALPWALPMSLARPIRELPSSSAEGLALLQHCVAWDPAERPSSADCMRSAFLAKTGRVNVGAVAAEPPAAVPAEPPAAVAAEPPAAVAAEPPAAPCAGCVAAPQQTAAGCSLATPPTVARDKRRRLPVKTCPLGNECAHRSPAIQREHGGADAASVCACKGHCYNGHKSRQCTRSALPDNDFCDGCVCCFDGCRRARFRGPYCYGHRAQQLHEPLRLLTFFAAQGFLPHFMPEPVTAFLAKRRSLRAGDLTLEFLAAWFGHALLIDTLVKHQPVTANYTVRTLRTCLHRVAMELSRQPEEDVPESAITGLVGMGAIARGESPGQQAVLLCTEVFSLCDGMPSIADMRQSARDLECQLRRLSNDPGALAEHRQAYGSWLERLAFHGLDNGRTRAFMTGLHMLGVAQDLAEQGTPVRSRRMSLRVLSACFFPDVTGVFANVPTHVNAERLASLLQCATEYVTLWPLVFAEAFEVPGALAAAESNPAGLREELHRRSTDPRASPAPETVLREFMGKQ